MIIKYKTLTQFGADFNPHSIDRTAYLDIMLLNYCAEKESQALERRQNMKSGYQNFGVPQE